MSADPRMLLASGQWLHQGFVDWGFGADVRREEAGDDPCPSVRLLADAVSDEEGEEDADGPRGHVHQRGLLGVVAHVADEGGRVGRHHTARGGQLVLSVFRPRFRAHRDLPIPQKAA
jgi:hypothetical protein